MSTISPKFSSAWLVLAATLFLLGCHSNSAQIDDFAAENNKSNIQKVTNAYLLMAAKNDFRGPKSEDQFREFLANDQRITNNLEFMGIDRSELDQYFVGRDGQPFQIRYGLSGLDPSSSAPLVFESQGIDDIRQVGFSNWTIQDVADDKQYQRLLKGKK